MLVEKGSDDTVHTTREVSRKESETLKNEKQKENREDQTIYHNYLNRSIPYKKVSRNLSSLKINTSAKPRIKRNLQLL